MSVDVEERSDGLGRVGSFVSHYEECVKAKKKAKDQKYFDKRRVRIAGIE